MNERKTLLQRRQAPTQRGPEPGPINEPRPLTADEVDVDHLSGAACFVIIVTDEHGIERTETYEKAELMLGRTIDNDVYLPSDRVSRTHAMITRDGRGGCLVVDMGSTNGTSVNGQPIDVEPTPVSPEDILQIGAFALRLYAVGEEPTPTQPDTAARPQRASSRLPPSVSAPASSNRRRHERPSIPPEPRTTVPPSSNGPGRRTTNFRTTVIEPTNELKPDLVAALVRRVVKKLHPDLNEEQQQTFFGEELVHLTSRASLDPQVLNELTDTAHAELFGLGALGPCLERPGVERVRVHRGKVAVHDGTGWHEEDAAYSCREAVERSVVRLRHGGAHLDDWEVSCVELREEEGGSLIDLRRRPPLHPLSAWAQHGAASPSMVRMLEQAMVERLNILVVGDAPELLGSLAMLTAAPEGLWIGAPPGSDFDGTVLRPRGEALAPTITSNVTRAFEYVFFPDAPSALDPLLEAVVRGLQGLVTMWPAQSIEVAIHRATTHLAAVRKCDVELAWSQIASCFDLAVEVGPGRDLRTIERIARFEGDGSLIDLQRHEDGRFESFHPPAVV